MSAPGTALRLLLVAEDVPSVDPVWGNGASLITWELLRHLPETVTVDLVCFVRSDDQPVDEAPLGCRSVRVLRPRSRTALRSLTSGRPTSMWQHAGPDALAAVEELSARADVTMLHGAQLLLLHPAVHGPLVVNEIDPWSQHVRQDSRTAPLPRRAWGAETARRTLAAERRAARRAAHWSLVNERDARAHAGRLGRPVATVPNGVAVPTRVRTEATSGRPRSVGFLGSLDYGPNEEAVERLAREVLPRVRRHVPDARLVVAGRRPSERVRAALEADGASLLLADFADVGRVFAEVDVAVFPPQRGFGTRNSLYEALAHGCPVVAAPSAARGVVAGAHLRAVAESELGAGEELAAAIAELLGDPEALTAARSATATALEVLPTWEGATRSYLRLLEEAASGRVGPGGRPRP